MSLATRTVVKPDASLKAIIAACYPDVTIRKGISIEAQDRPLDVCSYWDGGSRNYFVFYCLTTGAVVPMPAQSAYDRPMGGADRVTLPDGIVCVERSYFCGRDCGVTLHVNPANMPRLLPDDARSSQ
jgi:hypothetical protein